MSTQPTERVDLDIIEALDFNHTPACESRWHNTDAMHAGDAYALVEQKCPHCSHIVPASYRCKKYVKSTLAGARVFCDTGCGETYPGGPHTLTVLGYVRGSS